MSGLQGVGLLLLWGCACLWLPGSAHEAMVVSGGDDALEERRGEARHLHKRSTNVAEVEVYSVKVECTVTSRFAHTVTTSKALNKAKTPQEIFFEVDLPKTAFIVNFSMEINGEVYVGVVKEKEKAKKQYEKAVSSGQTAGLVKASGRKMEKFSVSVNIAAESNVTFILTYEELLQRKLGQYEILTRVKPKHPVQEFQIVTHIYEPQGLAFVDAHATFLSNELLPLVDKVVTENKARISFSPTMDEQRKCPNCEGTLIDGDFIIKYDVKRTKNLGDVQIVNGYFVHFFAPSDLKRVPKNVAFVIDRSGSMWGLKMEQTHEAMLAILKDLHEDDHFALIQFDDSIDCWRESFSNASKENVAEGMAYIKTIRPQGVTDINSGVLRGVEMLIKDRQDKKLPERSVDMVILLTDGMPNSGVTSIPAIQENVKSAIGGKMSLFSLGIGNDVDYSFLDVMSQQNKGVARRIFQGSDAALQLQGFYDEVASPLLSEVDLRYPGNVVDSLTTHHFTQLYNGSEIVVAGRMTDSYMNNFMVEVFGQGSETDFLVQGQASALDLDVMYPNEEYIFGDFTERLWAYLTIQQLMEKSKSGTPEEKANATAKALEMSLRYSFVTPLTSMVVTKPDIEDGPDSTLIADKLTEAQRQEAEKMGYHQARQPYVPASPSHYFRTSYLAHTPTYLVDGDPHFMIELPNREDALCFNLDDKPGTIFNLVRDPDQGILVNGEILGDKKVSPNGKLNTYFCRFGIEHRALGLKLDVSTHDISVTQDGKRVTYLWSDTASVKGPKMHLLLTKDRRLTVTLRHSVKFVILLHKVWSGHPFHRDYLGFYTLDSHLMSPSVHGLLGQFYHGIEYEVSDVRQGEDPEKPDATMHVKGHELNVTRGWQRDFMSDMKRGVNVPCWFVHSNGTGLIDGDAADYVVSGLFKIV
ncbi:inter-alpha-trypsin inhibitor heavy chain H3-like [Pseudoliparis swirei]|uniref:inter-alpha-trypsin inhibitor heavy chain H3-like n=1 Tax=Pseudoliparis swirei TaxID=2059687 RepID=UPI0024BE18E9|nr:inter-alpha-trypsin inhibitor heavy chain H3-like [Pseudoliparis swirei]